MLVLASASKARHCLLNQVGIPHKIMVSSVDEQLVHKADIKTLVQTLSRKKAEDVLKQIVKRGLEIESLSSITAVLACDSLFEFKGEIFGKPKNHEEATDRLNRMSSSSGILHTGHYFVYRPLINKSNRSNQFLKVLKGVVSTKIEFSKFSKQDINYYVASGEPLFCAGGFALEGKGAMFIRSINGCYSNVIGLSLPWLKNSLFEAQSVNHKIFFNYK